MAFARLEAGGGSNFDKVEDKQDDLPTNSFQFHYGISSCLL